MPLDGRVVPSPWRATDWGDAHLTDKIVTSNRSSRRSYGSPVHAELRLGEGIRCSRKRVERLMAQAEIAGFTGGRGTAAPAGIPSEDLVKRQFNVDGPDLLDLGPGT